MPNYAPFAYPPKVVTVEDLYHSADNSTEKIPTGYEPTGEFRIPIKGEYYLWCNKEGYVSSFHSDPRIILRKAKAYSDGEILDYLLEWINDVIPSYQVCPLSANVLKTCVIEKMRKEGK